MRPKKFAIQCLISLIAVAALETLVIAQVPVTLPPAVSALAPPPSTTLLASSSVLLPQIRVDTQDPWDVAADRGLTILKNEILTDKNATQNATLLGFKSLREALDADLDKNNSFQVSLVGLDAVNLDWTDMRKGLRQFRPGDRPEDLLVPLNRRLYPIKVGHILRSSLTVTLRNPSDISSWTPTNWGFADLIIPLMQYRAQFSSAHLLVWIPSLNLHFLGDNSSGKLMLIPIRSSTKYGFIAGNGQPAQDVFTKLAPVALVHDGNPG
jgi:hypothetical protein